MPDDWQTRLFEDFPDLYCHHFQSNTFYLACGSGWEPLLRRLSERITQIVQSLPLASPNPANKPSTSDEGSTEAGQHADLTPQSYCASQVKEKYGELRFYMSRSTREIQKAIRDATEESLATCETCGRRGKLRGLNWYFVACDEHDSDRVEAIKF